MRALSRYRMAATALVACFAGAGLSGCGMSNLTSGMGGGVFGSKKPEAQWTPVITEERLLSAAQNDAGGGQMNLATPFNGVDCPAFTASPNEKIVTLYEGGRVNDAMSVMHRGEITKTARECEASGDLVRVKYGFAGRVLLGPKAKAGVVTLNAVVYVLDPARNRVKSEAVKVQVQVSPEDPVSYFSLVKVIDFPVAAGTDPKSYRVFVAFERTAPGSA